MRFRAIALSASLSLLLSGGFALAQSPNEIFNIFGGIMRSAMTRATQAEWRKLTQNEIACIDQMLHQRGTSVGSTIQQGIKPSDSRIADVRSFCETQIRGQAISTEQNGNSYFFVANTTPPDAYLSLRTQPTTASGQQIKEMPNGTTVQVLQRRSDGWWFVRVIPSGEQGWALSGIGNRNWIVCCSNPAEATTVPKSVYSVDGLALAGHVRFDTAANREYHCSPSEQFSGFTWCQKSRVEREARGQFTSSYSILHSADGTAFYINRYLEPAFFTGNEANEEIDRLSKKHGALPRIISIPRGSVVPYGMIAAWGNVVLEPLDASSVTELAAGRNVRKGFMIDHIGDYERSAQLGLPIYRLRGGAGYVWAGSWDENGRGTLRFLAIDASAFTPQIMVDTSNNSEKAAADRAAADRAAADRAAADRAAADRAAADRAAADRAAADRAAADKAAADKAAADKAAADKAEQAKAAPLTDCDTYAASDLDPQRKDGGLPVDKLDPNKAIPACIEALERYSDTIRFQTQLGRAYLKKGDFGNALIWNRKAADRGSVLAQANLGIMYEQGRGVPKDDAQAVAWYRKAVEQGFAFGQAHLGIMYEQGRGVPKDDAQAVAWYRKAAEQGNALGQVRLGIMYEQGHGAPKDDAQAVAWYRKAAEQGNALGQVRLGIMYEQGRGVPKDDAQAVAWFRKAADQDNPDAEYSLGVMYANGFGVGKDYQEAVTWYRKAAGQGLAAAQNNLGLMYQNGWGVPKDLAQAEAWLRKAADQDYARAQSNLKLLERSSRLRDVQTNGLRYAQESGTSWTLSQKQNEMTDRVDVIAQSIQKNEQGAVVEVEGKCLEKGLVVFTALVVDDHGKPTVTLPSYKRERNRFLWGNGEPQWGMLSGIRRINSNAAGSSIFTDEEFSNKFDILVLIDQPESSKNNNTSETGPPKQTPERMEQTLKALPNIMTGVKLGMTEPQPMSTTWRALVQFASSRGDILIRIPLFESNIRKLVESCRTNP
jgi:TPR repeat protein